MTTPIYLRSWVESANAHPDFPLENLPLGIFSQGGKPRQGGVAVGDFIFALRAALDAGLFQGDAAYAAQVASADSLNDFFALGPGPRRALREALQNLLGKNSPHRAAMQALGEALLVPMWACQLHLPARVGDYTDFYVGIHHANNVGKLFRPDNPLLPNYKYVPIGYHGRASTICVSGTPVRRPNGQTLAADGQTPQFGPSKRLDYELELGIWIGPGNAMGSAIAIEQAAEHVAGFCLLNDWSARDIQAWEYQPLGPFLSKNFASSVSPWVVTTDSWPATGSPNNAADPGTAPSCHYPSVRPVAVARETPARPPTHIPGSASPGAVCHAAAP